MAMNVINTLKRRFLKKENKINEKICFYNTNIFEF